MKRVFIFSLLFSLAFASSLRTKRSVLQFRKMIHCLTDRSALLDYNAYGCWCGIGGRGDPVDDTDRCCRTHDRCYDSLKISGTCSSWKLYTESYSYSCKDCDTTSASVTCGKGDQCEVGLCQCDREAALCFRRSTFNSRYRYWSNSNC